MPDPDLEVIARLISQDPGLSGSLLKIVNSPYYGLSNKIASIQRAVNLLGSRSIINLINQKIQNATSVETAIQTAVRELGQTFKARRTIVELGVGREPKSNN